MTIQIPIGAHAAHQAAVTKADTAISLGSGDVPVLATPRVIAWMEAAAVSALTGLNDDTTSVGIHVAVDHVAPTLIGSNVRTEAAVRDVEGSRIEFDVKAFEGDRLIAGGTHTRVVVDRSRFLTRAGVAVE
jgi:predicted thioesterase